MELSKVVHRDFKPDNILINNDEKNAAMNIRVIDFGFAQKVAKLKKNLINSRTGKITVHGTPSYIAPEVLNGALPTSKSDVFGVGSVLYSVITHKNLFKKTDLTSCIVMNKICNLSHVLTNLKYSLLMNESKECTRCSPKLMDFITDLLRIDPRKRLSARSALQH